MDNKKMLFVIDEIELKYFEFNKLVTNFWLIVEFLKRGWEVLITTKNNLYLKGNKPYALCQSAVFRGEELLKEKEEKELEIDSFEVVFFRPDPPVDIDYINACYVLDFVKKETLVLNSPKALLERNEKLYVCHFPDLAPKNTVSANANVLKNFLFEHGQIVLKPLNRCFGSGVFYLHKDDKNIKTIIDTVTNNGKTAVMAQEFLEGIKNGDKRLIFLDGEIFDYSIVKKSSNNDFKFNTHSSENILKAVLSDEEKQIAKKIAPKLLEDGVYMAGLDVIDGKIIEINITSPCFFIDEINSLFGVNFETVIGESLERIIREHKCKLV